MHYRTSRYRTKIRYFESQERKKRNKKKQIGAQRMILSDLHYPVKIQHPANKNCPC